MKWSIIFLLISFSLSIFSGLGTNLDWITHLWYQDLDELTRDILWNIRFPRVVTVTLAGMSLSTAGVLSQGLFRNSLASPSLLGSDSAAVLGGILVIFALPSYFHPTSIPIASAIGASLMTVIIIALEKYSKKSMAELLLIGFATTTLLGGLTSLLINLGNGDLQKSQMMQNWLIGGFSNANWTHALLILICLGFSLLVILPLAPKLDLLSLGHEVAESLGVHLSHLRISIALFSGILLGSVTACAGALPFVGLMMPHITRLIIGPSHKKLLIVSMINGASFLLLCDLVARTATSPSEIGAGVVTTLVGSPFFLWLLLRKKSYA
jgi:iron complex transport system permease protein